MKQIFRTKIGLEVIIFIFLVLAFATYSSGEISVAITFIPILMLIFILFKGIKYTIDKGQLLVKNSIFGTTKINVSEIGEIKETNNPLSAPAGSLDRILVKYSDSGAVLISPINRDEFIKELLRINPQINVKLRSKSSIFSKLAI